MCNGYSSLEYTIGACPKVTHTWVQMQKPQTEVIAEENTSNSTKNNEASDVVSTIPSEHLSSKVISPPTIVSLNGNDGDKGENITKDDGWQAVLGKK